MTTENVTFNEPYTDIDEWRESPVRHRYVHGGFKDNSTRFSLYFPEDTAFTWRFFQHFTPVPGSENMAQSAKGVEDKISFAVLNGAYFVESNGGGTTGGPGMDADPTIGAYKANAEVAKYSRIVAAGIFGNGEIFGYCYGGSGGAFRTIGAAENTHGVWQGFVPFVPGSPMAIPNVFSVRMHAQRVLRNKLDHVLDAMEPGGSANPEATLNAEELGAFREVSAMGFPKRAWFGHRTMGSQAFSVLLPAIKMVDPSYFTDFWTQPGYLGTDPQSSVHADRVIHTTTIDELFSVAQLVEAAGDVDVLPNSTGGVDDAFATTKTDAFIAGVRIRDAIDGYCLGSEFVVDAGLPTQRIFIVREVRGDLVIFDEQSFGSQVEGLSVGQTITIDNSAFLAAQTYHRHQVPGPDYKVWDQFRNELGEPIYPQRPFLIGPMFSAGATGGTTTGAFEGKMILVSSLLDREAFPWQADWYLNLVKTFQGEAAAGKTRLWYTHNAVHGDAVKASDPTHTIEYVGILNEALLQLSDWVERGIEPAQSTNYSIDDGQVSTPETAAERLGVQPTATLKVAGDSGATALVGQTVEFEVSAESPPNSHPIVAVFWDFSDTGDYQQLATIEPSQKVIAKATHLFDKPGTYFVNAKVYAQRPSMQGSQVGQLQNLSRIRVVVS